MAQCNGDVMMKELGNGNEDDDDCLSQQVIEDGKVYFPLNDLITIAIVRDSSMSSFPRHDYDDEYYCCGSGAGGDSGGCRNTSASDKRMCGGSSSSLSLSRFITNKNSNNNENAKNNSSDTAMSGLVSLSSSFARSVSLTAENAASEEERGGEEQVDDLLGAFGSDSDQHDDRSLRQGHRRSKRDIRRNSKSETYQSIERTHAHDTVLVSPCQCSSSTSVDNGDDERRRQRLLAMRLNSLSPSTTPRRSLRNTMLQENSRGLTPTVPTTNHAISVASNSTQHSIKDIAFIALLDDLGNNRRHDQLNLELSLLDDNEELDGCRLSRNSNRRRHSNRSKRNEGINTEGMSLDGRTLHCRCIA